MQSKKSDPTLITLREALQDPCLFVRAFGKIRLRSYQSEVIRAVARSVLYRQGLTFVVMFPRQSGKNEVQAQLEAYLLTCLQDCEAEMVKISPTWKPQSLNAMRRLQRVLERNSLLHGRWTKENGYIYRVGRARIFFLSGEPHSNIVGATASALLEVDEAQDVEIEKYDKEIAPMAASTNATRVLWGTAWTSQTLLARELRLARHAQQQDGLRRVFVASADQVAAEVPAYARFVAEQVNRLGRQHPFIRSQYYSEEIDGQGGLFPPQRRARMQGSHNLLERPQRGQTYAFLLDVAGVDEAASTPGESETLSNPARDATALTIVAVDRSTCDDPLRRAPTYRCVQRRLWLGVRHSDLYAELRDLAEVWRPWRVVVDATGVGAGLADFLSRALPGRVIPFTFTAAGKSKLGWDFVALVESGRWKEAADAEQDEAGRLFLRQLDLCQYEILPGPEKRMRWGVPDGSRDPLNGQPAHDDLLISAALCTVLDDQPLPAGSETLIVPGRDPLGDLDRGF